MTDSSSGFRIELLGPVDGWVDGWAVERGRRALRSRRDPPSGLGWLVMSGLPRAVLVLDGGGDGLLGLAERLDVLRHAGALALDAVWVGAPGRVREPCELGAIAVDRRQEAVEGLSGIGGRLE